uniref:SCP domain-containing protein n=1 Tax=Anopheles atroparvus TaxID=41427 RepID=A0AAG5DPG6_ANOAO
MSRLVFACFALGGLTPGPTPTDYCTNSFCEPGLVNVGCNPPPLTGGPACAGKNPEVMEITSVEIDFILDKMNTLRQSYASGAHTPTFPVARSMPSLQWDAELASQAGNNVRSCIIGYDMCHNTAQFNNSGQIGFVNLFDNVAIHTKTYFLNEVLLTISKDKEYFENGVNSYSSYNPKSKGVDLAHVLNDRSSKVGCALQKFDYLGTYFYYFLICNFSANLIAGQPIYTQG